MFPYGGSFGGLKYLPAVGTGAAGRTALFRLERLRNPGLQEFAQYRCGFELRDRIEFLECRRERVGETPDRPRPELVVFRFEVEVVHSTGKMLGSLQFALHERLVDGHLSSDIRQLTSLPGLHLFPHRLEVALHAVDANRNAIDERERLRVLGENRCEHAWDDVAKSSVS